MKYRSKFNNFIDTKDGGRRYVQGQEYDETDIVPGADMNDFEAVESVDDTQDIDVEIEDAEKTLPDFAKMNRKELDSWTIEHTNIDPSEYKTKGALITAIEEQA